MRRQWKNLTLLRFSIVYIFRIIGPFKFIWKYYVAQSIARQRFKLCVQIVLLTGLYGFKQTILPYVAYVVEDKSYLMSLMWFKNKILPDVAYVVQE